MSWDGIVHSLLQTDCINRAALAGRDGLIWSASPGFEPSQQEILTLVGYCDGEAASPASFTLAGRRYLTLRRLDGCIDGKFSHDVATVALTNSCVVMGACVATPDTQQQQQHKQSSGSLGHQRSQQQGMSEKVHLAVVNVKQYLQLNHY